LHCVCVRAALSAGTIRIRLLQQTWALSLSAENRNAAARLINLMEAGVRLDSRELLP